MKGPDTGYVEEVHPEVKKRKRLTPIFSVKVLSVTTLEESKKKGKSVFSPPIGVIFFWDLCPAPCVSSFRVRETAVTWGHVLYLMFFFGALSSRLLTTNQLDLIAVHFWKRERNGILLTPYGWGSPVIVIEIEIEKCYTLKNPKKQSPGLADEQCKYHHSGLTIMMMKIRLHLFAVEA